MKDDCIFCGIARGDIPADVVYGDKDILGFRDIKPQAPVHILFIPREHLETLNDIRENDSSLIGRIIAKARDAAVKEGISVEGYRIVANCNKAAGQEVFHVHFHLLGGRRFSWPPG